jgi:AcrR family transcriptional regulator
VKGHAPSRRDTVAERTREDIIVATAKLLARSGHRSVALHDIAAELGLTGPALYAYFKNKEAIFDGLRELLSQEIQGVFAPASPPGLPFRARLGLLLRRQLELADRRREMLLAVFALHARGEGKNEGPSSDPAEHMRIVHAWFVREARPADLGGLSHDEAAAVYNGIVHGYFMRWIFGGAGPTGAGRLADQTDRILEIFFHGVLGPAPAPRRSSSSTSVR